MEIKNKEFLKELVVKLVLNQAFFITFLLMTVSIILIIISYINLNLVQHSDLLLSISISVLLGSAIINLIVNHKLKKVFKKEE